MMNAVSSLSVYTQGALVLSSYQLDVVFIAPFKEAVDTTATAHMEAHVTDYLHENFSTSERRILLTKWIRQAWEEVSAEKDMVIRGFRKCGISVAIDSSEDDEINIKGLEGWLPSRE